jgi:hypothetical protein
MTVIVFGLVMLLGCTQFRIRSDYEESTDFQRLHTYGWRPRPTFESGDPRFDNSIIDARVRATADRVLAAKGYTRVESGSPDFLVGYHAVVRAKTDVATIDRWYGYRGGGFALPHYDVRDYDEGTLLIDIIDPASMKLLWRGTATAAVLERADVEKREKRADQAVSDILAKFPPKP